MDMEIDVSEPRRVVSSFNGSTVAFCKSAEAARAYVDTYSERQAGNRIAGWRPVSVGLPDNDRLVDVWVYIVGWPIDTGFRIADCRWNGECWLSRGKYITGKGAKQMLEDEGSVVVSHWVDAPLSPTEDE